MGEPDVSPIDRQECRRQAEALRMLAYQLGCEHRCPIDAASAPQINPPPIAAGPIRGTVGGQPFEGVITGGSIR